MNEAEIAYAHLKRPFACIDLNALDLNIAYVNNACGSKGVRIATKSIRSMQLLHYIHSRLKNPAGFMTFDLNETARLLDEGFTDLLVGYPQLETLPMEQIIAHLRNGRQVTFMIDSFEQWSWLDSIGAEHSIVFDVCIDLNVSSDFKVIYFGTKRSPLTSTLQVVELLTKARTLTNTKVTGIMGYEAQIAGIPDTPVEQWQKKVIKQLKIRSQQHISSFRKEAVNLIKKTYSDVRFVNGGGSGSIAFTSEQQEVTEITVGSAFYFPALFSRYENLPLQPSTAFGLRVTRKPEDKIIVCHGGGYIASGACGTDKNPVPFWPENLTYLKNEGAGEVQTPLKDSNGTLQIGDTVYFRHAKAGELCERFPVLHARRGTTYEGPYTTYRGEGDCFL